jgi:hypothetical protein
VKPAAQSARSGSHSETLATLRAAPGENLTPRSRGHAGAKAVSALAMQIARLVSTLHGGLSRGKFFLESSAKTSTWWGGTKGGKGTQHFPECQARRGFSPSERSRVRAVDNPALMGIDSPSFRVAREEKFFGFER